MGRRIEKNVTGTITTYVYDNEDIILAYNAAGNIKAKYTHGLNIDEPLAVKKSADIYYYHADGLGSIVALTDATGAVVETYSYDSFGNMTKTGDIKQPFTYTGREFDPETGLYYYRARYYNAKAGRFLQRDPIGFGGGINLYAYVGNNPVNRIDPRGLFFSEAICYIRKFSQEFRCRFTEVAQGRECEDLFRINPRQCKMDAARARERCIKDAENEFKRCMKECE